MKPRTRKENYLAKIAKDPDAVEMTPKTRTEHYLNEIAENGGGGGDVSGSVYFELVYQAEKRGNLTANYFRKSDIDMMIASEPAIILVRAGNQSTVAYRARNGHNSLQWVDIRMNETSSSFYNVIDLADISTKGVLYGTAYEPYMTEYDGYGVVTGGGGDN